MQCAYAEINALSFLQIEIENEERKIQLFSAV